MQEVITKRRRELWGAMALGLLLTVVGTLTLAPTVAHGKVEGDEELQALRATTTRGRGFTVGKWAYRRLDRIKKLLSKEKYAEGLEALAAMQSHEGDLNAHERALMWQMFGFFYGTMGRHAEAAAAFEKCLALDGLDEGTALTTQFNLVQMYLSTERFAAAAPLLADWLARAKNPDPSAHHLMAITYAQIKKSALALQQIKIAISRADAPPESWFQLQLSLLIELRQYRRASQLLLYLATRYDHRGYWLQLSAVYGELGDETRALAVFDLAYRRGLLTTETEFLNLARWHASTGAPLRAASLLEELLAAGRLPRNLEVLELLGNSLLRAREYDRAVEPLSAAAALAEDGNIYLRLAHVHLERQAWSPACEALHAAAAKGGIKDLGNLFLLLGTAEYSAGRLVAAGAAFDKARGFDHTREAAVQWLIVVRGTDQ